MTFDEYQEFARSTAVYPEDCKVVYPTLGLCGEAGEVAEKIKKHMRDGRSLVGVGLELGDVLWYISALADDLGVTLEEIAQSNVDKLQSRKERGKIGGSGDNR
jgi:NTP pyrophosphatase (non-canonical NTP hydrolase)